MCSKVTMPYLFKLLIGMNISAYPLECFDIYTQSTKCWTLLNDIYKVKTSPWADLDHLLARILLLLCFLSLVSQCPLSYRLVIHLMPPPPPPPFNPTSPQNFTRVCPLNPSNAEATFVQSIRTQNFMKTILTLSCWYPLDSSRCIFSDEYPCSRIQSFSHFPFFCIILYWPN